MARYKLILAYNGAAFAGSQRQAATARSRTGRSRTVQGALEDALRTLGWQGRSVLMAGRTDAGAHASGQVAAVDLDWPHAAQALRDALNAHLPAEMAVSLVESADAEFHPRFDAKSRRYRYRLFCQQVRNPLYEHLSWRVWPAFDEALLRETAAFFMGRHDFGAFGSAPAKTSGTVRSVSISTWHRSEPGNNNWQYDVTADAFLYRMVRRLVFVQVAAAQGRCSRDAILRALESGVGGELPAGLAPAHGLELMQVDY